MPPALHPVEWPLIISVSYSPIQETTTPVTQALSLTLRSWMRQAAQPQCWPQPPTHPWASLSSHHHPSPQDLGAAAHPARLRPPQGPTPPTMPSACWMRSFSAWVRPGGRQQRALPAEPVEKIRWCGIGRGLRGAPVCLARVVKGTSVVGRVKFRVLRPTGPSVRGLWGGNGRSNVLLYFPLPWRPPQLEGLPYGGCLYPLPTD